MASIAPPARFGSASALRGAFECSILRKSGAFVYGALERKQSK
jgi:hypothetical protein